MKFEITKHTEVEGTNIFGKAIGKRTYYTIDRVIWFVFRFPLEFTRHGATTLPTSVVTFEKVYVRYRPTRYATQFLTREGARIVLHDIYQNPNKYIRTI